MVVREFASDISVLAEEDTEAEVRLLEKQLRAILRLDSLKV